MQLHLTEVTKGDLKSMKVYLIQVTIGELQSQLHVNQVTMGNLQSIQLHLTVVTIIMRLSPKRTSVK